MSLIKRYQNLFAFLAGIAAVIAFYFLGRLVLGPLLMHPPKEANKSEPPAVVASTEERAPHELPISRQDMPSIPERTIVTIEPVASSTPEEEEAPSTEESEKASSEAEGEEEPTPVEEEEESPSEGETSKQTKPTPPTAPSARQTPPAKQPVGAAPVPAQPSARPVRPSQPTSSPEPPPAPPKRYHVQVGVFDVKENADRLLERLTEQGYLPNIKEETVGGKKRYRVIMGAFDDKEPAENLKRELEEKGFVERAEVKSQ